MKLVDSWRHRYATLAIKTKLTLGAAAIALAALTVVMVVATLAEQAAKPIAIANEVVGWIWGEHDEPIDSEIQAHLEACLRAGLAEEADTALSAIPAGINPDKAYGWLLYSLAGSSADQASDSRTSSTAPSRPSTSRERPSESEDKEDSSLTFAEFSRRWNSATNPNDLESTSTTEPDNTVVATPSQLVEIDPVTDYAPYVASAAAATVRAIDTDIISGTDDDKTPYLQTVSTQCFQTTPTTEDYTP